MVGHDSITKFEYRGKGKRGRTERQPPLSKIHFTLKYSGGRRRIFLIWESSELRQGLDIWFRFSKLELGAGGTVLVGVLYALSGADCTMYSGTTGCVQYSNIVTSEEDPQVLQGRYDRRPDSLRSDQLHTDHTYTSGKLQQHGWMDGWMGNPEYAQDPWTNIKYISDIGYRISESPDTVLRQCDAVSEWSCMVRCMWQTWPRTLYGPGWPNNPYL